FSPFLNSTIFKLITCFYETTTKSFVDLNRLVYNVLLDRVFNVDHLAGFDAGLEAKRLDSDDLDNWQESTVKIKLPQDGVEHDSEDKAPELKIPGVLHCDLLQIMISVYQDLSANAFNWKGFKQMWKPSEDELVQQVYGFAYSSEMEDEIEGLCPEGCTLEAVVAPSCCTLTLHILPTLGQRHSGQDIYGSVHSSNIFAQCLPHFLAHHLVYIPLVSHFANPER
ncbi:hypothetical protein C8J56DRAFT_795095, partial [Mycena floridula]